MNWEVQDPCDPKMTPPPKNKTSTENLNKLKAVVLKKKNTKNQEITFEGNEKHPLIKCSLSRVSNLASNQGFP